MTHIDPNIPPPYYQDDEMTLKDLILKIQEFWRELWENKLKIVLFAGIIAVLFLLKTRLNDTTYTAGLSFMVAENTSGEQNFSLTNSQFDFSRIENNKITELARSGRIVHQVLLKKAVINSKNDFLANHLIDLYGLHNKWEEEPLLEIYKELHLRDFYFTRNTIDSFSQKELRALSILHELIVGNNLLSEKGMASVSYNDRTEIFRLDVEALEESLSMAIMEAIFEELKRFYVNETIGRPQRTFELLSIQVDSLFQELAVAERRLAVAKDQNRSVVSSLASINMDNLQRNADRISTEYDEAFKNKKKIEFLLSSETPEFQIIDRTFFPVENSPSKIKAILIGAVLGTFLSVIFVISRKIIRDAMIG